MYYIRGQSIMILLAIIAFANLRSYLISKANNIEYQFNFNNLKY